MARVKFYKMEMISFKTLIECSYMLGRKRPASGNKDGCSHILCSLAPSLPFRAHTAAGAVAHACHPSTGEAEAGGCEFRASLNYTMRPWL